MASLNSYQNSTNIIITILLIMAVLLHHLLCPVSCFNQPHTAIPPRDEYFEEKSRLGSMPPSCHNRCNQCHPCMAVQVPNLQSHDRVRPGVTRIGSIEEGLFLQDNNRYSNYKPLSWKCHCGGNFFNP